jgi:TM2 domain-containing membrane protein YozV
MPSHNGTVAPTTRRSPIVAVILSGLFPGLGQLYNRQRVKALLFLGGGAGLLFLGGRVLSALSSSLLDVDIDVDDPAAGMWKLYFIARPFLAVALACLAIQLWSVIDAYRVAKRSGR